jgi:hypothetical protein
MVSWMRPTVAAAKQNGAASPQQGRSIIQAQAGRQRPHSTAHTWAYSNKGQLHPFSITMDD